MQENTARPVTVKDMMLAREARVMRQQALLHKWRMPLLSFCFNIPGPIKSNPLIRRGFALALDRVEYCLARHNISILQKEVLSAHTGEEALLVCQADALQLKGLLCPLEAANELGKLMDLDVIDTEGLKISRSALGFPPRGCLLCDQPAQVCAPARSHPVEALYQKTQRILHQALQRDQAQAIGQLAQQCLILEALVTPKPGLVDQANTGAHQDMSLDSLIDSAFSLGPFLEEAALTGMRMADQPPAHTMAALRPLGLAAEKVMFQATDGVNTHKGALYALGILSAAAGRLAAQDKPFTPDNLFDTAALMAAEEARHLPQLAEGDTVTNGIRQYQRAGVTGARGEAAAGYPSVRFTALPQLKQYLAEGHSLNDALAFTLLHLMAVTQDTNLMKRAGQDHYQEILKQIKAAPPTLDALRNLDQQFIRQNLSPGGSADLLAVTCFSFWLERV